MSKEIEQIVEQLESLLQNKDAKMFVTVETGYDECNIIGTRDAYLRLAKVLLEFVGKVDKNQVSLDGTGMPGSSAVGYVFDSLCEVDIDSMTMSETEQQAREQMEYLRDL